MHIAKSILTGAFFLACGATTGFAQERIEDTVNAVIEPLMKQQDIAGMAVAITHNGERQYFNYGVASKDTKQAVTDQTLFEIGSVSKTFTATLGAYAQAQGKLSLSDPAGRFAPELSGSALQGISLLNLATYTPGGLPLQFPGEADHPDRMFSYYKAWKPLYPAGTQRLYSNPSIGLFGYLAARSLGRPFDEVMEQTLMPGLGLKHSYVRVPKDQLNRYAQGYAKDGKPVRVGPGALDSEAYGVKTSSSDLIRFIEANLRPEKLDADLRQAIATTHTGFYKVSGMTQGLGWEFYPYPVTLDALLAGNTAQMALMPQKVAPLDPPSPAPADSWINKTGSTGGFGAYAAFVPGQDMGIVMLANKNYPIEERVKAAHKILTALEKQ
ncbi:class C beta-lactamase [Pseudomonas fluorescens]|uniref:Beta-lactamase n=1 Tax=Pseudomonas fluorescens TaxID=294 RepID=A0A944HEY4_PSEFL|nr:class C beta-lactamase [Pseudomonas fluorescens]MBT2298327.1 beta-lactamase [Pseudomonas fluorescens]MBT2309549.1 beta-lactamase [Pseudomonas fluorescens]MBT2314713.1 beta-lactamase [Pseudomonas fluorescens]MBT2331901.1 beta-lactamase [Pseudomonas fluorescens]MBT2345366.1 beta-lactamase [Pseudomonas fluorescens]